MWRINSPAVRTATQFPKLVQLAEDDFVEYLRIVVRLLPKAAQLDVAAPFVERPPEPYGDEASRFVDALKARANVGQITPAIVLARAGVVVVEASKAGWETGRNLGAKSDFS